eukprot:COSAG02_NODE_766_length_17389_cov_29.287045_7_plen_321_part_00
MPVAEALPHLQVDALLDDEAPSLPSSSSRRAICTCCARPTPVACLCGVLPEAPLATSCHIIVLTHPSETKRSLTSTSQLLGLLLEGAVAIVGRIFREGEHPVLDKALAQRDTLLLFPRSDAFELPTQLDRTSSACGTSSIKARLHDHIRRAWSRKAAEERAAVLFPTPSAPVAAQQSVGARTPDGALKIARRHVARQRRKVVEDLMREEEQRHRHLRMQPVEVDGPTQCGGDSGRGQYLIVLDGTWTEVSRLLNQNERLKTWPVCIKLPGASSGEFLCRAPPQPGYVSTLEAIGRTLLALSDEFGTLNASYRVMLMILPG